VDSLADYLNAIDKQLQGLRVLLAEDNVVNQKVAMSILRRLGCEVQAVDNGRLAVEAVKEGQYDVVLMDIQMPELDGLAATVAIRRLPSAQRSLPIIAVTANAMQSDREACMASGMDDFMPKPITFADVLAMLVKWDSRNTEKLGAMNPSCDQPIYDPTALEEAFGDDMGFVTSVLLEYLASAKPLIQAVKAAVEANDAAGLSSAAHTLKGSSRTVGAMRTADVAGELEALGRAGTTEGAAAHLDQVQKEFSLLTSELESRFDLAA
jgi:CheY-like chemotaxis protein